MTDTELSPLAKRAMERVGNMRWGSGWALNIAEMNAVVAAVESLVLAGVYGDVPVLSPLHDAASAIAVLAERVDGLSRRLTELERVVVTRAD